MTLPVYSIMRESRLLVAGIALYGSPGRIEPSVRLRKMPFDVHFCQLPSPGTWRAERTEGWENQVGGSNDWLPVGGLAPRIELSNLVSSLAIDLCLCGNTYDGHGQESVMWYMSKHGFTSSTASFRSSSMPHCSAAHVSFCQTSCLKSFVRGGNCKCSFM